MRFARPLLIGLILYSWLATPGMAWRALSPTEVCVEAREGHLLHALTYRSATSTPVPVILSVGWTKADTLRWEVIARELCVGGFDVIIPQAPPRGQTEPSGPEALVDFAISAWADSLTLSLALQRPIHSAHLICIGEAGWEIPRLLGRELEIASIAWIAPQGDYRRLAAGDYPLQDAPRLLLISARDDRASSALAGDLFSRFNRNAEFWLLSVTRDELMASVRLQEQLRAWFAPPPRGD